MVMGLYCAHARVLLHIGLHILFTAMLGETINSSQYQLCEPLKCGGGRSPEIRYPFYIPGKERGLCGYPGFEIICQGTKTMYGHYSVERISYEEQSIQLVNEYVMDAPCFTPRPSTFYPVNPILGHSYSFHPRLRFFYNCTGSFSFRYPTIPVNCTSNPIYNSFVALIHPNDPYYQEGGACQSSVEVPVELKEGLSNQTIGDVDYKELLKEGFILKWDLLPEKNCQTCRQSNGRCGLSDEEHFCCYCPDGTRHHKDCNSSNSGKRRLWLKIGHGIGIGSLIIGLLSYVIYLKRKNASHKLHLRNNTSCPYSNSDMGERSVYFEVPIFTSSELEEATNNFSASNELGDGGFGTVYYGKLRDGREVAVKRLNQHSHLRVKQFMNEVEILTRLRHKNLVLLYGCTSRHSHELLLVYEYVSNGTVADHIHSRKAKLSMLPWHARMSIAIETATALAHLHASDIIHRDVTTNNILLDSNFSVKVADFGLSRLFPNDVSHISTSPQGTPGYVDPEYYQCYQLTEKSDVYSFGVVLIELISSKTAVDVSRARHEINLANLAVNKIQKCAFSELIDPTLGFELDDEIYRMTTSVAELTFRCLQQDKEMRPSMDEVLKELKVIASGEKAADEFVDVDGDENVLASPPDYDDVQLLKNMQLTRSPVSVTQRWDSISSRSAPSVQV
ncbi:LEAF RUST 10 DISEASE-RESISTANCE LOCUS RECEPTOR-LIKE PROTEIN KINASE-like 1.2 isoform X2 [Syzygium oleosum]|uniref:LEAF RUST 10 DISEASE-RESISTANCE LOCUS RECEPTOR-LIKE PROTEIN KINASE-like 1.2 isoform X2 n=1 Tax=Syzygium oleosum TaxID=219896 RepID=UPI0024BB3B87|nr:LEAF RUST 10 DISEASE-RESISTANCE LOCUS RECEPTOR-LIKE PROTEIN KINASE-like 1.2 isoform X2 [Syzygium oleosum]